MYFLFAFAYQQIESHILPLIIFSTINNISISVKRSNFTIVYLKAVCHANIGPESLFAGSNS